MKKDDDLSLRHLRWRVESRASNQQVTLKLFELLGKYPEAMNIKENSRDAQDLVAVCFSLWRAAFLADKSGESPAMLDDARIFLGKMLVDNAINYSQDRIAREWTFNYYMNNATACLLRLGDRWSSVAEALGKVGPGDYYYERHWTERQEAFAIAVDCFADDLEARK